MKKIFAILVAICLLASALSITAFAAESDPIVMDVSGLKKDGKTIVSLNHWLDFADGWECAVDFAEDEDFMEAQDLDRIIVDLRADWKANDAGEFGKSSLDGFQYTTIYVPSGIKLTINLNGYTINRGLSIYESDGEVMYIDDDADVIINNGTITGGYSSNGAGAIHIKEDATVTLNDVNFIGNRSIYSGGAISVSDDSTLIVNGGRFENNRVIAEAQYYSTVNYHGGAVYVKDATAIFKKVTFVSNQAPDGVNLGAAISADDSQITAEECIFDTNGAGNEVQGNSPAESIIEGEDSTFAFKACEFTGNGGDYLFSLEDCDLTIEGGKLTGNVTDELFHFEDTTAKISDVTITDNTSALIYLDNSSAKVTMSECVFNNNTSITNTTDVKVITKGTLLMENCSLGDITFEDASMVKITYDNIPKEEAAIAVSLQLADGTTTEPLYYKNILFGWNDAIEKAQSGGDFERVIVDFYSDWNSNAFGAVTIPENARMTINLNGHKIDRAIEGRNWNGEVMYVSTNADLIINDGTITGGVNRSGAGGIHINDGAKVVLNDVNLVDNIATEGSNGAAIAVYNGATLVMNGGSLSKNYLNIGGIPFFAVRLYPYGTLYVNDATATLNNVTISDNSVGNPEAEGAAIYADNSTVTMNDCVVSGNINVEHNEYAESVIGGENSTYIINNTDFIDNGDVSDTDDADYCSLFDLVDCKLTMVGGKITGNHTDKIFYLDDTEADITGVNITGNASIILDVDNSSAKVTMTECTLGNNEPVKEEYDVTVDTKGTLIFKDCELGDTIFDDKRLIEGVGSMIGEGSLPVITSLAALFASIAAIGVSATAKKKKSELAK